MLYTFLCLFVVDVAVLQCFVKHFVTCSVKGAISHKLYLLTYLQPDIKLINDNKIWDQWGIFQQNPIKKQSYSPRPLTHTLCHGRRSVETTEESVSCSSQAESSCTAHNQRPTERIGERHILKQIINHKCKKINQMTRGFRWNEGHLVQLNKSLRVHALHRTGERQVF